MERPIGDKFKINGCVYVVVEDSAYDRGNACDECVFIGHFCGGARDVLGYCSSNCREDGKSVHFEHFGVAF